MSNYDEDEFNPLKLLIPAFKSLYGFVEDWPFNDDTLFPNVDNTSSINIENEEAQRLFERVLVLVQQGDYEQAFPYCQQIVRHFEYALQIKSQNLETYLIHIILGDCYLYIGCFYLLEESFDEALTHYNNAINHYQNTIELAKHQQTVDDTLYNLVRLQLSLCFNDKGVILLSKGIENYDSRVIDISSPIWKCYELAIEWYPNNPLPLINMACLGAQKKDKKQMRTCLEAVMPLLKDTQHFRKDYLIFILLNKVDFGEYRNEVLTLLLTNKYIEENEFNEQIELFYKGITKSTTDLRGAIFMGGYVEVAGDQIHVSGSGNTVINRSNVQDGFNNRA